MIIIKISLFFITNITLVLLFAIILYIIFFKKNNFFNTILLKNKQSIIEINRNAIKNEKRLIEAQRIARIASIEKDNIKKTIILSDYVWELFEIESNQKDDYSSYFINHEFIYHEDKNYYLSEIERIKKNKIKEYQINYRIITTKGNIKHITSKGIVEFKKDSTEISKIHITIQDISYLKETEKAISISERKFSDAFNLSPVIMAITTIENEIFIDVNDQFLKIFNVEKSEIIGKSALDLNIHYNLERRNLMFKTLIDNGFIKNFETKIRLLNGEIKIFSFNGSLIDFLGKKHFLAIVNDITEIKNSEKALSENQINLQHIFDYSPVALLITGVLDGKIIKYNVAAKILLKIQGNSELNIKHIFNIEDFNNFRKDINKLEKVYDYELKINDFEGEIKWALFSVDTIEYYDETVYLISIVDITYRKKMEEEIMLSELKFSKAFNNSPEIMMIVDFDEQKFVDVNLVFDQKTKFQKNEVINQNTDEFEIIENSNDRVMIKKLLRQNNRVSNYQTTFYKNNNEIGFCYYSAELFKIKDKKYVLTIVSDITDIITSDNALKISEEKYRLIVENTTDGVYIYRNNQFVFFNKRLQIALGYTYKELNNMHIWDLIHPDDLNYIKKTIKKRTKKNNIRLFYEARVLTKNGEIKICEFTTKEIIFNDSPAILGIVHDITELRNAENELKEFNKYLESKVTEEFRKREEQEHALIQKSKLEFLGEMAAGMSHEINQPLTGISMGMENILNKINTYNIETEYFQSKINNIFHYVNRIQHIIEHVRTFSRDQQYAVFEKFSVNDTINNTLLLVEKPYSANKINININFNNSVYYIKGNKYRLEQVILNLLSNSKDALEEKNKKISSSFKKNIDININSDEINVYITIKDNGIGIKNQNIDNIFEPFYTSKEANKGTGLGLSIVYGIVKEFQGEIFTESKLNEYTIMKMTFPKYIEK
jgi:PAS domain S-box-containing protein